MNTESRMPIRPLAEVDIVLSIFNQEKIIERILHGIFENTLTPFHLILVFDGCTDGSEAKATGFIRTNQPPLMRSLVVQKAPNVYETRANNIGFRLACSDYMVTLQDDMEIKECGWEIRLTYPLRAFDRTLAVTGRIAQDIGSYAGGALRYTNRAGRELNTLRRTTFAVRDIINRGPIAFRMEYLRTLGYLNESYAPSDLDDADLALRGWEQLRAVCGALWIDYVSKPEWSKAKANDSTMHSGISVAAHAVQIAHDHAAYLAEGTRHSENIRIGNDEIDYPEGFSRFRLSRDTTMRAIPYRWDRILWRLRRIASTVRRMGAATIRNVCR